MLKPPANACTYASSAVAPLRGHGRWASVKAFLGSWRRGPPPSEVPLPVDKLKCHLQPGGEGAVQQDQIEVLQ